MTKKNENVTPDELEEQEGEQLPDREVMSVISASPSDQFVDLETGDPPPDKPEGQTSW